MNKNQNSAMFEANNKNQIKDLVEFHSIEK